MEGHVETYSPIGDRRFNGPSEGKREGKLLGSSLGNEDGSSLTIIDGI